MNYYAVSTEYHSGIIYLFQYVLGNPLALILGFTLWGIVQALVSHKAMAKALGCDGPRCLTLATLFGIVVSFIFADLIILPILDRYRKYYSWKVMGYILHTFYITMAAAGYIVEFLLSAQADCLCYA